MGARKSVRQKAGIDAILPQPKRLTRRPGVFRLVNGTPLELPATQSPLDRRLLVAAEQARHDLLARTGLELSIERPRTPSSAGPSIRCRIDRSAAASPRAATARDA